MYGMSSIEIAHFVLIRIQTCPPQENLTIPENTTLVTVDVTSLYTNIPHDDGIATCRKIWEQRTVQEPPTECLVEMLTLVLKKQQFYF
jgi:hypothetical protein